MSGATLRFDATTAECRIFTFKQGALSKFAHDLELRVTRWQLEREGDALRAHFDPKSIEVQGAVLDGHLAPALLSTADRDKIVQNLRRDVLEVERFPEITFDGQLTPADGARRTLSGELTLHGVRRSLALQATLEAQRWRTEVNIDQRDYGIVPYSALLGALKLQPRVRVVLSLPARELDGRA